MVGARIERKNPVEVMEEKRAFPKPDMEFAALKNSPVLIAGNR